MSFEAWGSPPDTEPERCPLCDGTEHVPGCEIRELERRYRQRLEAAVEAERKACAAIASDAAKEAERIGKLHPEDSASRDRMFARAREAESIAGEIMMRSNWR